MIALHILVIVLLLLLTGLLYKVIFFQKKSYEILWKKHEELKSICRKIMKSIEPVKYQKKWIDLYVKMNKKSKRFFEEEIKDNNNRSNKK